MNDVEWQSTHDGLVAEVTKFAPLSSWQSFVHVLGDVQEVILVTPPPVVTEPSSVAWVPVLSGWQLTQPFT
jgi:hypothetical protein